MKANMPMNVGLKRIEDEGVGGSRQQAAIAELAQLALTESDLPRLMEATASHAAEILHVDDCQLLELLPDRKTLLLRAGVGWSAGLVGTATVESELPSGIAVRMHQPVWLDDLHAPQRWRAGVLAQDQRALGCMRVAIPGLERPFGVLAVHTARRRRFRHEDVHCLQAIACILASAIERRRAEAKTAMLLEVTKDISGTLNMYELLDRVQRRTVAMLPCDGVATFYWDPPREVFRMIAEHGTPADLLAAAETLEFRPGDSVVEELTRVQTIVVNEGRDQSWLPYELLSRFRVHALVATRLRVSNNARGAVIVFNKMLRPFDAGQVELLEGMARQLAMAIEAIELAQAKTEEAEVSGALARAGQEMISSLDAPVLLNRLCQLTTEVLRCDCSVTLLWKPAEEAFAPVASFGTTPEEWEAMRVLRMPRELFSRLEEGLDQGMTLAARGRFESIIRNHYGVTSGLYVALRRGTETIGVHAAYFRGAEQRFSPPQERIARGIAHLASLALEHARVVKELENANRLKADFVTTMSHELRTPLNIIMGYNTLLAEGEFGSLTPDQADVLRRMDQSAGQLLALIETTLDLGRLETGRLPLEIRATRLAQVIDEIAAETRSLPAKLGVEFVWDVTPGHLQLHTDGLKLKVILKNLVANAFKFTEQGRVAVRAIARGGGVEIRVSDTGIGIPPTTLPIIFEPFRQAESALTRHYGGVGLGLYVVRRLLDLLGGTIAVDSRVGRGSTFRVWIPSHDSKATHRR